MEAETSERAKTRQMNNDDQKLECLVPQKMLCKFVGEISRSGDRGSPPLPQSACLMPDLPSRTSSASFSRTSSSSSSRRGESITCNPQVQMQARDGHEHWHAPTSVLDLGEDDALSQASTPDSSKEDNDTEGKDRVSIRLGETFSKEGQEKRPLSFVSFQGLLLTIVLPFVDALNRCYFYACVPLQFIDHGWPLWELSVLLFTSKVGSALASAYVLHKGDQACVQLFMISTLASAGMAWLPNNRTAVQLGIFVHCVCSKGSQAYRGLIQQNFGRSRETQAKALNYFILSDVLGYSVASFVGGILYETGGFQACAYFQVAACATQTLLTHIVCTNSEATVEPAETEDDSENTDTLGAVSPGKLAPTLAAGGSVVAASFAIFSIGVSVFLYTAEWNTFAMYFREVYGWGSAWTGFAQSIGDLTAGLCLVVVSSCKFKIPAILGNRIMHVAVVFGSYAIFYWMLASSTFAVAVAGQVAMGLSYVLSVELFSAMLVVYGRGDRKLYRRLIFAQDVAFTVGTALSSVAVVVYDVDKTLPFYGCAVISFIWGSIYVPYLCIRGARVSICGSSFSETEEVLLQRHLLGKKEDELLGMSTSRSDRTTVDV